jgi:hypothetical protein
MTDINEEAMNEEMDQLEVEIQEAFETAIQSGKDEDNTKLAMIGAGATFKNVTRLYNKFMIDAGLAISKTDRDAAIAAIVGDPAMLIEEETFLDCVAQILEQVKGSTERSAGAMLRSYAKANGAECFKKTKEATGARSSGFRANVYELFIQNPDLTEAELDKFANEDAATSLASDNDRKQLSHYHGLRKMVNAVAVALRG